VIPVGSGRTAQPSADLVRRDLIRMGFRPEDITYKVWPTSIGAPPPADWDIRYLFSNRVEPRSLV
jgi:hypothetical protein